MKQTAIWAAAAIAASMGAVQPAAAYCAVDSYTGVPDTVVTFRMRVTAGDTCTTRNMTHSSRNGDQRTYPTSDIALDGRPKHGTATVNGSRIIYVAQPGFKGADSFSFTSRTKGTRNDRSYRYRAEVTVL